MVLQGPTIGGDNVLIVRSLQVRRILCSDGACDAHRFPSRDARWLGFHMSVTQESGSYLYANAILPAGLPARE
ncbi:hypothetical protein E2562_001681 [Oryza meyeriana var. granulata]|uniref:Uncharacterized protein n=1 Tax=Oryza meyeriana var. granulata TaxID=110450 RepID=A0A6G1CEF0_9ORYZ|nr:hypothetical protein E2562_001681 [Oryza meyeriana var. granulata]